MRREDKTQTFCPLPLSSSLTPKMIETCRRYQYVIPPKPVPQHCYDNTLNAQSCNTAGIRHQHRFRLMILIPPPEAPELSVITRSISSVLFLQSISAPPSQYQPPLQRFSGPPFRSFPWHTSLCFSSPYSSLLSRKP